jgi:molybdopterin converting factor small subunit
MVEANGATVKEVLENLTASYPGLQSRIFDQGQVRRFINLYLNNEDIRYMDNLATATKDGDELAIIPAVAGG